MSNNQSWEKPAALAIPETGYFTKEEGRYGLVYPKTPANYGFTVIAKIKPGTRANFYEYAANMGKLIRARL